MQKMEEVGRETLLKAVDIVNSKGNPTYGQVEEILLLGHKQASGDKNTEENGQVLNDSGFYVEQRDPTNYAALFGDSK
jgi:hypothetical protein